MTKSKARSPRGFEVFKELEGLITERPNFHSRHLDRLSSIQILKIINAEDGLVASAVRKEIPFIAQAVEMAVKVFRSGGRLFYVGAGTSGRLGVLDAAECPPTFGTDPKMIKGIIAGGYRSLLQSKEGAEDDVEAAISDIRNNKVRAGDLVIGITASKRTPYVIEGLRAAKKRGASTVFICCNPRKTAPNEFDVAICPVVGPEVVAGSSRMKAGTAQKMILNMITSTAMARTGRLFGNRMVDLKASSEKLKERSKGVLMDVCRLDYGQAEAYLRKSGGNVKTAIVMAKLGLSRKRAESVLKRCGGFVYKALEMVG